MTELLLYEKECLAHTYVLSRVGVCAWLIKQVLGLDDWIYCTLYIHSSGLQAIRVQPYHWHTRFTVHRHAHTRVLSLHQSYPGNGFIIVSLSLQITHRAFFSETFSCHYSATANSEDSIKFLCSQAHIPAGWCPKTRLLTSFYASEHFFITTLQGTSRKQSLLLRRRVYWSVA
jgi:hypothetical protein